MNKSMLSVLLIIISMALVGCSHVAAWERGNLAKPHMTLDPQPLQSKTRSHLYGSREAGASSNASSGGGGCGCY